jgi:tripartite-type tricarboxylate transporter receptor subunit TctC
MKKLLIALAFAVLAAIPADAKQIFLTTGTTWVVPADWDSNANTIEAVGGGSSGNSASSSNRSNGAGGAYSKSVNVTLTPGATVGIAVGTGGASVTGVNTSNAGGDTYLDPRFLDCSTFDN